MRRTARLLVALALATVILAAPVAGQNIPPDGEWRTFETQHFSVTHQAGLERVARRAADRAEWAHALLTREFVRPPEGRIALVISDNVDFSNGAASPFPRNRIVLYVQPPAREATLAYNDDWLQLLILHELVHIFHLDYASGVWPSLRTIFGRDPVLFPQIFTPSWVIEGLATFLETEHTSAGRARGSLFDMILRTATLEDAFFEMDRVTIDPVTWPTGNTAYVYGSLFMSHLAERFGPDRVAELVRRVGRQIVPYRPGAAAREVFGTSLDLEWRAWEDSLRTHYAAVRDTLSLEGLTRPEILTEEGRFAYFPRYSPDASLLTFAANTGRSDPGHVISAADGTRLLTIRRSSLSPVSWTADGAAMLFDQIDFDGPYRVFSDLYLGIPQRGATQLTKDARVWEPDARPGTRTAVAVHSASGTNQLVMVDLDTGTLKPLTDADLDRYWAGPRWSPAGDRIATGVWRPTGRFDVVVLDSTGRLVREIASGPSVDSDPAWSPDSRYILFSSDRTGIPNLFAFDLTNENLYQVTNVLTGAFQPDISPDGRWIAFSLYAADGYHIARIPFDPSSWRPTSLGPARADAAPDPPTGGAIVGPSRDYSPYPSLLPAFWSLSVAGGEDFAVGITIGGEDVIERHLWEAELLTFPTDRRLAGSFGYTYRGWGNPVLDFASAQDWVLDTEADEDTGDADLLRREREVALTVTWLHRRWHSNASFQTGVDLDDTDFFRRTDLARPERQIPRNLGYFAGVAYSTLRSFGLSIGSQEGVFASARVQARRRLDASETEAEDRGFWRVTTRSRAYRGLDWFGFGPPTLAARFDAGVESVNDGAGFSLGGAGGLSSAIPFQPDFLGRAITYPLRGYPAGIQRGNRIASASLEYRFPVALVERGVGLFPLALDRITGDLFLDAGAAWCSGSCSTLGTRTPGTPRPLTSAGAEAIVTLRAGYATTLPIRLGVAAPFEGGGLVGYVRVGAGF